MVDVQFSPASYRVEEGDSVDLTVVLSMAASRPVSVRYATRDGQATGTYA